MKKRLEDFKPVPGLGIKKYNILLLGAIGSGKSSFFNTVFAGSVKSHAPARSANAESVTNEIHAYELKSKSGKHLNLQIFDIRGFDENRGYNDELEYILNGRLPAGFTFPEEPAPVKEDKLIHASLKNEMHLVCFVTGTSGVDAFTKKLRENINNIKECVNRKGLPVVVVVTKLDEFSENIFEDANQVYRCFEAHDAIKKVSDFFGIQEKYIFPIVNYINDDEIKEGKDMLTLHALDEMVRLTNDYIEKHKEKTSIVDSWAERENKLHIPLLQRLKDEKHAVLTNLGKEMTELGDNTLRILCVGTVNSGKTSFVDSILSTLRDEICSKASGGYATGGKSKFQMYRLRYKKKLEQEDKLCSSSAFIGDLPGFQENLGIQLEAVKYIVQGHVPNSYKIKDGINRDSDTFKLRPEKKDKVNCVCFIFDISTPADELPGKIQETFKNLQRWLLDKKIPYIVILTKGDLLNADVGEGKYQVFKNNTLKENKDKLIKMFGYKQSKMFPVVNYIHEDTVVPESDALLIAALKEILKLGKQYFEDSDEKDTDESDNEEKGSEDCETNKANS
ncbi:uncharacterized protein LOC128554302 isoform X2 [Mercenaria mercenaria]|uniref:uncharacterized protein LOC128554302 isoform X2 n=1 Tax=Mercenaria mercenaria TaxID=6596 RepID=UPI00234F3195|nr:uncharacterized protein LOC128554302 isoform X2 [Mercenaria mercenaria]